VPGDWAAIDESGDPSTRPLRGLARDDAHDPVIPSEEHRIVSLIGDGRVDFLQARYHY